MKKLLTTALLAVASASFLATPSFAGCCFGLCYKRCGCCGCGAKFCVRQYNAFSPVCSGTVFCDGCCPFGSCGYGGGGGYGPGFAGGCGPCAGGMCPGVMNYSGILGCPTGGCADGACLGSLPACEPADPGTAAPPATATNAPPASNPVVSPSPLPNYLQSSPTSQLPGSRTIQNASYVPATPAANPARPIRMQPQPMAAPSYWGN